jgi:peptidoglycan/LPS O-acetylase OafA/YrhL
LALLRGQPRPSVRAYLANRALRILPAYLVILIIVSLLLGGATLPNTAPGIRIGSLAGDPGMLVLAMTLLQSYTPATLFLGIGPAWSLSVEAAFYVALPVTVWLAWAINRRRFERRHLRLAVVVPPLILLLVGMSGKLVAAFVAPGVPEAGGSVSWRDVITFSFWGQADLFAAGMVLAAVYGKVESRGQMVRRPARRIIAASALVVAVPGILLSYGDGFSVYAYRTMMSVVATLVLALVVLPSEAPPRRTIMLRVLTMRWLVGLGLMSYSIFLWHEPLVHVLAKRGFTATKFSGLLGNVGVVASVVVACSVATYLLVERPTLRRKRRSAGDTSGGEDAGMTWDESQAAP